MSCWDELRELKGKRFKTLKQHREFLVESVSDNWVIIIPQRTKTERVIFRKEIERTFEKLSKEGDISRAEIEKYYSPRNPAYVAALLANLPGIRFSSEPVIVLRFEKKN